MSSYNIDDEVTYISKNNYTNRGSIVRFLRNGNVIIKNKNKKEEKIINKNIITNLSNINNIITYTKNLESECDYLYFEIDNSINNYNILQNDYNNLLDTNNLLCTIIIILSTYIFLVLGTIFYSIFVL